MPDLTMVPMNACRSTRYAAFEIGDYYVEYSVPIISGAIPEWGCSCLSFKYRKECKHLGLAKEKWCGWDQQAKGGEVDEGGKCPECSGETLSYMAGV